LANFGGENRVPDEPVNEFGRQEIPAIAKSAGK
jgi:hypothetical protein